MDIYAFGSGLDTAQAVGPQIFESNNFYGQVPIAGETAGCVVANNANSNIKIVLRDPATNAPTSITEGWIHFRYVTGYNGGGGQPGIMRVKNSSGAIVLRIYVVTNESGSFTYRIEYWNGSAFVTAFTGIWTVYGQAATYDLYFKIDAAQGKIQAFANGTLVGQIDSINTSGMTNVGSLELTNCNDGGFGYWGWIIAANGSTISHLCRQKLPTADGANTAWTGTYADVDEYPVDDGTYIQTSTAGDKENFTGVDFAALPTGNIVKAVGIGARVRNNGATPSTIRGTLTIGGTDYTTADCSGVTAGWGPTTMVYLVDPSTSAPWTNSLAHVNVPFGIEART